MTIHRLLDLESDRDFISPREVRLGDGVTNELTGVIERWGVPPHSEILLVCDKVLSELGQAKRVVDVLVVGGHKVRVFDDITREPDSEIAENVAHVARSQSFDAVVGMGGGSSMDLGKVAAVLARSERSVLDLVGIGKVTESPLPLFLIPTTAGTGAEATRVAMISHDGEKQIINDPHLVATAAILDSELVASLPPEVTAATGLDALTHSIEAMMSITATPVTGHCSRGGIEMIAADLRTAYHNGDDLRARRGTLYAAYLAGLGLNAGVVLGHSIAYTIANRAHLPHGVTAAMALPYCTAYNSQAIPDRIELIWEAVGDARGEASDIYEWLDSLNTELGVPSSLAEIDIRDESEEMALECVERYPRPTNPFPLEIERLNRLYEFMEVGDLDGCKQAFAAR